MSYFYEKKPLWDELNQEEHEALMAYAERYKCFLDRSKTEREATETIVDMAKKHGFIPLEEALQKGELRPGMKIYLNNRNKSAVLMVLGENLLDGMQVVASHIDVPRLDLKPFPLYEEEGMALLKTHYYGGVKKYQWTTLPLALHGVATTKEGRKVEIVLGEDPEDPVFYINDLLIHLSKDQMNKTLAEGITGEELNVVIGHASYGAKGEKNRIKELVLEKLHQDYGMVEEDFMVAEFEMVPAGQARDVGIDRAMIAAHGHDDRVCAYASLEALLQVEEPKRTAVALFVDKEEIGSVGNTGARALFFDYMIEELLYLRHDAHAIDYGRVMTRTKILSADVTAAMDPTFPEVLEKRNAARVGYGVTISKYTGARGKGGCSDANQEFLAEVREIFEAQKVRWQIGELGKIDQGGGGTIAGDLAHRGAEILDCGTPMLSMHAPWELVSKADAYMTMKAYRAFFTHS